MFLEGEEGWGWGGVINITWIRAIICHWNPVHFSSPLEDLWPGFHIVLFLSIRERSVWMYILKSGKSVDPWKLVGGDYFGKNLRSNSRLCFIQLYTFDIYIKSLKFEWTITRILFYRIIYNCRIKKSYFHMKVMFKQFSIIIVNY